MSSARRAPDVNSTPDHPVLVAASEVQRRVALELEHDLREFGQPLTEPQLPAVIAAIEAAYGVQLEVVSKRPNQHTFEVLPRRWVVERTFAWLGRSRILSKEYTRCEEYTESWIYLSSIQRMVNTLHPNDARTTRYQHRKMARKTA